MVRAGALLPALALLAGCAGASVDRWAKIDGLPAYVPPVLTVSSAPAGGKASPLSVKSLPDRTAAAYVTALADKAKSSEELRGALAKQIGGDNDAVRDATVAPRVLVVGVERESPRPGDRLLSTIVSIRPAEPFRFVDFEQAATDRAFIDVGQVSITDTRSASVGVAPGASPMAEGVTANLAASRTQTASRSIRAESDLTVDVSPELIRIYRSGVEGRDLTGDTLVKLSLRLRQDDARTFALPEADLRDDKDMPTAPDKLRIKLHFISIVPAHDLWVCARLAYEDRTVVDGARSYDEGRQSVALRTAQTPWTPYLIAPVEELETPLWVILDPSAGALGFNDGTQVNTLAFDDYDGAVEFLAWIKHARSGRLANGSLVEAATNDPIRDFATLEVRRLSQTHGASSRPTCG